MILEPGHRFFKQYDLIVGARKSTAKPIPLLSDIPTTLTVESLIQGMLNKGSVADKSDHDLIQLMSMHRSTAGNLVLFFHRDALKAAAPVYRTSTPSGSVSVSKYKKKPNEEQAVSCHLVISPKIRNGAYPCVLEEVPGMNMGAVLHVLKKTIFNYSHYSFKHPKTGKVEDTYATIKAVGFQSEKLKQALSKSRWNMVTLTKPADSKIVDGIPFLKPKPQTMEIKVDAKLPKADAYKYMQTLAKKAFGAGWEDFRVDIEFDDDRKRGVSFDRNALGQDILFVKSTQLKIHPEVENCSAKAEPQIISAAETLF